MSDKMNIGDKVNYSSGFINGTGATFAHCIITKVYDDGYYDVVEIGEYPRRWKCKEFEIIHDNGCNIITKLERII